MRVVQTCVCMRVCQCVCDSLVQSLCGGGVFCLCACATTHTPYVHAPTHCTAGWPPSIPFDWLTGVLARRHHHWLLACAAGYWHECMHAWHFARVYMVHTLVSRCVTHTAVSAVHFSLCMGPQAAVSYVASACMYCTPAAALPSPLTRPYPTRHIYHPTLQESPNPCTCPPSS